MFSHYFSQNILAPISSQEIGNSIPGNLFYNK